MESARPLLCRACEIGFWCGRIRRVNAGREALGDLSAWAKEEAHRVGYMDLRAPHADASARHPYLSMLSSCLARHSLARVSGSAAKKSPAPISARGCIQNLGAGGWPTAQFEEARVRRLFSTMKSRMICMRSRVRRESSISSTDFCRSCSHMTLRILESAMFWS